jgi:hypothetical protein
MPFPRTQKAIGAIGRFATNHPVLSAGVAGTGVALSKVNKDADKLEGEIMREQFGYPGARYASELEKFAERKMQLATKLMFEKVAGYPSDFNESIGSGLAKAVGGEGLDAIRRLLGSTAQMVHEKFVGDPAREQIVDSVIQNDPDVSSAESLQPGQAYKAFRTMTNVAPTLSRDPNIVTSFLRQAAMTGGVLDYNTVKGLAEAEAAVQRAKHEGAWLYGGFK